jgi:thioredoxin-like negative regulator of GroEL
MNFADALDAKNQEVVPDYEKVAKQVKDYIKIGAVNVEKDSIVSQQLNIETFPSIALVVGYSKPEIISEGNCSRCRHVTF